MVKLLQDTYSTFRTIFTGMGVTWRHLFTRSVTIQYPEERDVLPGRVRLKLDVNMDDCIGCRLCERACPVDCITIDTIKTTEDVDLGETSTGHKKKLWVAKFDIDMAKCCYCELCVHPCPTDCITMVEDYEYSTYNRNDLILPFSEMNPVQIAEAQRKLEQEELEKEKQKEAARLAKEKKKAEAETKADSGEATGETTAEGTSEESGKSTTGGASDASGSTASSDGSDAEKEKRRAEREARRAERRAAREAQKKNDA
jgi:NADH-quinone oxidoreductase subunit I